MSTQMLSLRPGSRVAVFAPSGVWDPVRFGDGVTMARSWGLELVLGPHVAERCRYLAGDDEARLADLTWALCAPGFDAAWMARGGYGLTRLLHRVPWHEVKRRPVIGFSDGVALQAALWQRAGVSAVHGPVLNSLVVSDEASQQALRGLLFGQAPAPMRGRVLVPGRAEGPLLGGNLCMLATLCGTQDQLKAQGAILVLEDIAEAPYRLDRLIQQLKLSGVLDGVVGVALGEFTGSQPPEGADWTLDDVFIDQLGGLGVPVLAGLPIGHGRQNQPFVVGSRAVLDEDWLHLGWGLSTCDDSGLGTNTP